MSDLNNEFVASVKKENNLGCYRLHTIWKNDGFRINIATKDASWSGEMTPENIKLMSAHLQLDNKTYLDNCKDVLTTNDGTPGISYMVENGSFVWKKLVDEDSGIKVKMGAVPVTPSNFVETIQKIVDVALNTNKNLQKEITNLTEEKDKLSKNNDKLFLALDEAKKCKIKMENDLYEKFIELLNSKKKRITDLQNKLEDKGVKNVGTKPKVSKMSKPPPPKKIKSTRKNALSDKDAYEVETENDSDEDVAPLKSQRRSARLTAKSSQSSDNSPNSQEIVTRKRTVAMIESSQSENNKSDVEVNIDSDSTISDEELYTLARNANEEKLQEKASPKT